MSTQATTHELPGLVLTDHTFALPLDHERPDGERIAVFAREVRAAEQRGADLPWLIYFQGGPGHKSPRPLERSGWLKTATEHYRVLLLDQRGTGRSTPVRAGTLARRGDPTAQADYLTHFRADAIVRDAELIRRELAGGAPWSALGQSFGGFCVTTYLSLAPDGLREAMITGGLPPLRATADDVYRATYRRVEAANQRYFARYPEDAQTVRRVVAHLAARAVQLPDGSRLTPERFLQLGIAFGMSDGFARVHYLLEEAFDGDGAGAALSDTFLFDAYAALSFASAPLYAIVHEACYCQHGASRWSAQRVREELPAFDPATEGTPLFTGEMIYPWLFDLDPALQPLKETAEILAQHEHWPRLYDVARLQSNTVPVVAAVYYDDMYVERAFSEEAAATIRGCRVWLTNQYQHNALRADGETLFRRLLDMLRGNV
jgi:pimeloyl-ACP methyl ester carboxylesterase